MRGMGRGAALTVLALLAACGRLEAPSAPTSVGSAETTSSASTVGSTAPTSAAPTLTSPPEPLDGPTAIAVDVASGEERWREALAPSFAGHGVWGGRVLSRTCEPGAVTSASLTDGTQQWSTALDCGAAPTGFVVAGATVVSRAGDSLVGLAAATGAEQWRLAVPAPDLPALLVGDETVVVASTGAKGLVAVEPATGTERWRVDLDGPPNDAVVAAGHVVVSVGSAEWPIAFVVSVALDTGAEAWRQPGDHRGGPVAAGDLVVFATTGPPTASGEEAAVVVALDPASGATRWEQERSKGSPGWPLADPATGAVVVSWLTLHEAGGLSMIPSIEALDPDGTVQWEVEGWSAAAVVEGIVIASSEQGQLAGLDARTGEQRWAMDGGGVLLGATGDDGIAVLAVDGAGGGEPQPDTETGTIVEAFNTLDGEPRWRTELDGFTMAGPALVAGDVVAIGACLDDLSHAVHGIDVATGERLWTWEGGTCDGLVGAAGTESVVVASAPNGVSGIDPVSGEARFSVPLRDVGQLAASEGGVVAITSHEIVVLDPASGAERWRSPAEGATLARPTVTSDALLVPSAGVPDAGAVTTTITLYDLATGSARWSHELPQAVATAPVVFGDVVVAELTELLVSDSSQPPGPLPAPTPPLLLGLDLATGTERWRTTGRGSPVSPIIADRAAGTVVTTWTASNEPDPASNVPAFDVDGQQRWSHDRLVASGAGGGLVLGSPLEGLELVALDAMTGAERWRRAGARGSCAVAGDAVLVLSTVGGSH